MFIIETTTATKVNCDFSLRNDDPNENYDFLTNTFINIVNKHAPIKKKFKRRNQVPFCKNPAKENEKTVKRQRNKYVALGRKNTFTT